jgi:uncharacterized protein YjbI with pentapeptide repeats
MKRIYVIVMMVIAVALSVAVLPSSAQDDWPEDCQLPNFADSYANAKNAQVDGDVTGYLNALDEMANITNETRKSCLITAVEHGVVLTGARLSNSNLEGINLVEVSLDGASLHHATLQDVNLDGADLQGADFFRANLVSANLYHANLERANLDAAHLEEANLAGANLRDVTWFDYTIFNEGTLLPDGTNWTPDADIWRFQNPDHPDFWDPCVELGELPWYCEDSDE